MKFAGIMMACLMVTLIAGCTTTPPVATKTEATICRELGRDLPTFSMEDTRQTQGEVARFADLFAAVCPGGVE